MKITFKRGHNAVCIHAARVSLDKGRIVYHLTANSPGDEITLKDETLIIEDEAGIATLASLMDRPMQTVRTATARSSAALMMPAAMLAESPDPPAWSLVLVTLIAMLIFGRMVWGGRHALGGEVWKDHDEYDDSAQATCETKNEEPKGRGISRNRDGNVLPALVTSLAVVLMTVAFFGIFTLGDDAWLHHPTGADLADGVRAGGLCLLCSITAYLAGRNDGGRGNRRKTNRLKLPGEL